MAQEFAKNIYNGKRWKKCRKDYIKVRQGFDGGLCEICHEKTGYIVHHKTELTRWNIEDDDIVYGFWNLQYVCLDCHNNIHNPAEETAEGLTKVIFGSDGEIVVLPPL